MKTKTLLVPVSLIILLLILHSLFSPFKQKSPLKETPLMIEDIRGIGQLITADYSGEVIATLQEELTHRKLAELKSDTLHHDTTTALLSFQQSRAYRKHQLIVVGRGRVRAGIDFSTITEKDFRYLPDKKRIYLYHLTPAILYCDINPWYIPEKKIRGFDILAATRQGNNPDDLLLVKTGCLRKLREQALKNGMVELARENAEETLREWFSVLMGVRIEDVIIVAGV
jgi:hypothetical protein